MAHAVYVSGLSPGFKPIDVAKPLCVKVDKSSVTNAVMHDATSFFLICKDEQTVESILNQFYGKPVYHGSGQVSKLTPELKSVLMQLQPELFGAAGSSSSPVSEQVPSQKIVLQLSDVLEAVAGWTLEQKQQLGVALGFNSIGVGGQVQGSGIDGPQSCQPSVSQPPMHKTAAVGYTPVPQTQMPGYQSFPPPPLPQPVFTSSPHPGQSFQFGSSNTINNIRVSTFSGSSKDCSYEQFRQDVHCLLKQGCPEVMVLNAIKRSIKGQAQELVLHMGEDATVADILSRYEIMFGDVNPPHVLLAQFYAASQVPGESVTDWYSCLEDLASRITRKDTNVISPNNYDILVNTQFWTRLHSDRMKNALRHKFDLLAKSPQLIVEARKIESEFMTQEVKVNQVSTEISAAIQEGFEKFNLRLSVLEKKFETQSQSVALGAVHTSQPGQKPRKNFDGQRKPITCFKCHRPGHIAKNCHLNSQGSDNGSSSTSK